MPVEMKIQNPPICLDFLDLQAVKQLELCDVQCRPKVDVPKLGKKEIRARAKLY